jgi:hypothetical protein
MRCFDVHSHSLPSKANMRLYIWLIKYQTINTYGDGSIIPGIVSLVTRQKWLKYFVCPSTFFTFQLEAQHNFSSNVCISFLLNNIQKFSLYLIGNPLRLRYIVTTRLYRVDVLFLSPFHVCGLVYRPSLWSSGQSSWSVRLQLEGTFARVSVSWVKL